MGTLIEFLMKKGLSDRAASLIAYIGGLVLLFGAFTGLVLAYNHHIIGVHEAKQIQRAKPATDQAATERAHDITIQARNEQETHDAIHAVPDAAPAGPSHALACQRLRKRGHAPASCG